METGLLPFQVAEEVVAIGGGGGESGERSSHGLQKTLTTWVTLEAALL